MRTQPELKRNTAGKFEIRWSEKANGTWRSRRKATGTDDYSSAVAKLSDFLTIRPIDEHRHTVKEVVDHYIRYHSRPRGNDKTDGHALRAPLGAFGDWPASTLTDLDIENYTAQRLRGRYGSRPVKSPTIRREIVALQAAMNFAVKRELIKGGRRYSCLLYTSDAADEYQRV